MSGVMIIDNLELIFLGFLSRETTSFVEQRERESEREKEREGTGVTLNTQLQ